MAEEIATDVPPNVTVSPEVTNPVPVMVSWNVAWPAVTDDGIRFAMTGADGLGLIVNEAGADAPAPLLLLTITFTVSGEVTREAGMDTTIWDDVADVIATDVPLNVTVSPEVANPVPAIVSGNVDAPAVIDDGLRVVMTGATGTAGLIVNVAGADAAAPLLSSTITLACPAVVSSEAGIVTSITLDVADVIATPVPANVTVSPVVANPVPLIVSVKPGESAAIVDGDRLVITGAAGVTVKGAGPDKGIFGSLPTTTESEPVFVISCAGTVTTILSVVIALIVTALPLTVTNALAGLKLLPLMVSWNWPVPSTTLFGERLVIIGWPTIWNTVPSSVALVKPPLVVPYMFPS